MTSGDFRRKLTAVMSADVVGYSRLMGEDEAATVRDLSDCRNIIADLVKQHKGRVLGSPGDNILSEFASAVDAVQCAVAVQKELNVRNAEKPENRRMEFRIGINIGDVIEEGGEIYGDGVNIAARLEALAEPGGICISRTAFDQIETKLPLGYEFIGEKKVKNIVKPVPAYRVLMEPKVKEGENKAEGKTSLSPIWKAILSGAAIFLVIGMVLGIWKFYLTPTSTTISESLPGKIPEQKTKKKPFPSIVSEKLAKEELASRKISRQLNKKEPVKQISKAHDTSQKENFPPVGTRYTRSVVNERRSFKRSFAVIEDATFRGKAVRREAIIGRKGIKIFDKESNNWMATLIEGEVVKEAKPHEGVFKFPLHVGKKYISKALLFKKGWKRSRDITRRIAVTAFEKVKVPAGSFDAFRVEVKGKKVKKTYWYSPKLKLWVKRIERHRRLGKSTTELIEYERP